MHFQSLSLDIAAHHSKILQLLEVMDGLKGLINIDEPENRYEEALSAIAKLQDNVDTSLKRLQAFKESWSTQELLTDRIESWLLRAERELAAIRDASGVHMRQFWVSAGLFYSIESIKLAGRLPCTQKSPSVSTLMVLL